MEKIKQTLEEKIAIRKSIEDRITADIRNGKELVKKDLDAIFALSLVILFIFGFSHFAKPFNVIEHLVCLYLPTNHYIRGVWFHLHLLQEPYLLHYLPSPNTPYRPILLSA